MGEQIHKGKSTFQKQLERAAAKNAVLLILVGCLFFTAAMFTINYLNTRLNVQKHLDFLNETFTSACASVERYLSDPDHTAMFLQAMKDVDDSQNLRYSVSRYNVKNSLSVELILSDSTGSPVFTTYKPDAMNLHRTTFNRIVCGNSIKQTGIYHTVYYFSGDTSEYVFSKPLYAKENHGSAPDGYVNAYLSSQSFAKLLSDYQYDSIITTTGGDIIYCSRLGFLKERSNNTYRPEAVERTASLHRARYLLSRRLLPQRGVILYSLIYDPKNALYVGIGILTIIFLGVVWLLMSLKLTKRMAVRNARSVSLLADELRIIRGGDSSHVVRLETGDEFDEIGDHINRMVKGINDLNSKNTDLIRLNSLIEISNLQTQINPHFIYNALDNIKYLIFSEPDKAALLIERFTHILRYSINNTKLDVLLAEDLTYIRDYLYIQKTRFGARFACTVAIPDECLRCRVPKLLLQPLIENSIKYGFKKKMEIETAIRGFLEQDTLVLTVEDDGPGVPRSTLEILRTMLASKEIRTEHNGLQNLARRIVLEYGADSGMAIDSLEGEYFKVTIRLKQT